MIITILIVLNLVLAMMAFWKLSTEDKFFTRLESGNMKFVIKGETYAETIREDSSGLLGLYWIGIYPFYQIKEFAILVDVENPHAKEVDDWVKKPGEKKKVKSLRRTIPRPLIMKNTELEVGKSTVDILVSLIFEVVDGKKFIFDMKADFAPVLSVIQTEIINILKGVGLEEFLNTDAGDQTKDLLASLINDIKDGLNDRLVKLFGLKLKSAGISNFQVSDLELRKAMEADQVAKLQGDATRTKAIAEADAALTKAKKEAEGITALGAARNAVLKGAVESLSKITPEGAQVMSVESFSEALKVAKPTTLAVSPGVVSTLPLKNK